MNALKSILSPLASNSNPIQDTLVSESVVATGPRLTLPSEIGGDRWHGRDGEAGIGLRMERICRL